VRSSAMAAPSEVTSQTVAGPIWLAAELLEKRVSETAINLVLRDRRPPPNQNAIFEVVSLGKDPASGGSK